MEYGSALAAAQAARRPVRFVAWGTRHLPRVSRGELLRRNVERFRCTGRYIPSGAVGAALGRVERLIQVAQQEAEKMFRRNNNNTQPVPAAKQGGTSTTSSSSNDDDDNLQQGKENNDHDVDDDDKECYDHKDNDDDFECNVNENNHNPPTTRATM
jgi:hypothetical protein